MIESKSVLIRRGLAWAIDSFLVLLLISVVVIFTAERHDVPDGLSEKEACSEFSSSSDNCLVVLDEALVFNLGAKSPIFWVPFFGLLANFVVLTALTGFSIGKLICGIRVISRDSKKPPGFTAAVGRTLPWIAITAIPQIGLGLLFVEIGLVVASSDRRRLGDRIAGTLVANHIPAKKL